jgi:uncharacterized protein
MATVLEVDVARKRISLSLKSDAPKPVGQKKAKPAKEEVVGDMQSKLSQLMGKFKS